MSQDYQSQHILKLVFQVVLFILGFAFILSASRLFITAEDRAAQQQLGSLGPYDYDLSVPSQRSAFLAVIVLSALFILAGWLLEKYYPEQTTKLITKPVILAGSLAAFFVTVLGYPFGEIDGGRLTHYVGQEIYTIVLASEWVAILAYGLYLDNTRRYSQSGSSLGKTGSSPVESPTSRPETPSPSTTEKPTQS